MKFCMGETHRLKMITASCMHQKHPNVLLLHWQRRLCLKLDQTRDGRSKTNFFGSQELHATSDLERVRDETLAVDDLTAGCLRVPAWVL